MAQEKKTENEGEKVKDMVTEKYIMDKILYQPKKFYEHLYKKEWAAAKKTYEDTVAVVYFLELHMDTKFKLFGNRPYTEDEESEEDGLFREEDVQKVYLECAVKRDLGRENSRYTGLPKA